MLNCFFFKRAKANFFTNSPNYQNAIKVKILILSWHCLVVKKVRENRKEKKIFFTWIFNIITDVDVLMLNFLIPRMETRESGKGNPRKY